MSEVFNGMNEVPNSKDIISDNRKSNSSSEYGIHLINEPPSHTSYSQGISQPSSDLQNSNFTQSQTVYSSQISSYSTGMEYQNPPQQTTADDQNVIRNSIPSNFQIPFSQGHVQMNSGLSLTSQGPLLSNGNYSNLKHMHPHNLTTNEQFVSMQPQGLTHSQYGTNSNSQTHNPIQTNPQLTHPQINNNHPMQMTSDLMISRSNMVSNHSQPLSMTMPQENLSNMQSTMTNHYMPVNRNIGMISSQHSSIHSLPHHPPPVTSHQTSSHSYPLSSNQGSVHYLSNVSNSNYNGTNSGYSSRNTSSRNWHSNEHSQVREAVAEEIVKILKSRKPNAGDGWNDKLPHMAKRLEDALYHEALTYDEYSDRNTLKQRLQQLALTMGNKNSQNKSTGNSQAAPTPLPSSNSVLASSQQLGRGLSQSTQSFTGTQNISYPQTNLSSHSHIPHTNSQQPPSQYVNYQQQQLQQRTAQAAAPQYSQINPNVHHSVQPMQMSSNTYHSGSVEYQSQLNPNVRNIPSSSSSLISSQSFHHVDNPSNDSFGRGYHSSVGPTLSASQPLGMYKSADDPSHYGGHQVNNRVSSVPNIAQVPPVPSNQMNTIGNLNSNLHPTNQISQSTDEHRKQVLKQQQQRLLLLRHASKCPHESGRCPVTPHCWNMKQLWKHIMSCKDQDCKVAHCVSSRYVLSHYSKCKEPTCPVCGPVREAIKRNYERSRDVVKMARNANPQGISSMSNHSQPTTLASTVPQLAQKSDEPEKKKLRRKSDTAPPSAVASTNQAVQPLIIRQPPRRIYPLDPISSAIYSFSNDQIQAHFRTIHEGLRLTVAKIKEMCKPIVEELFKIPHVQGVFGAPVDPIALGLSDYFEIVKVPMDLGTVIKRLDGGSYRDLQNFVSDVSLTFDNAMLYNPKNTDVYLLASNLKKEFDKKYRAKIAEFEKSIDENRKNKDACLVCGEVALKYEPPVYYCNGTCAQRIRRNAVFYSNNSNTYHWCSLCFNAMKESDVIRFPDCSITKSELAANKKKHIEESGEGWVECEGGCKRWVHQICSLFNNRRNVSDDVSYVCPLCLQEKRRKSPNEEIVATTNKKMKASDLPVTTLSDFLEKRIYKRLSLAYEETAAKYNMDINQVEKCPPLTLRQVSCVDKLQPVREGFYNRYKDRGYPTDFPCRSKCLVLFQNIDGQDVILFGMYVYEYGHKCPQPNQRRVYVSYLDSVHYLRPKQYRTMVYHEILISYLDYVRARGFHTVHIWACPPQKGDDYILYVHPQDQKTPKPQILRVWYDEMLKRCLERGIVCEMTDFHTEFLADPNVEAITLPYFEGDYWVNEAEVIIKSFGEGRKDDDAFGEDSNSKSKRRSKSKRPGKIAPNIVGNGKSERDPLMAKLAGIIDPMKDTFFVARLHPKEYAEKFRQAECSLDKASEEANKEKSDKELQEEALCGQDIVPQLPEVQITSAKGTKRPRDEEIDETSRNDSFNEEDGDSEDDFMKNATMISANDESKEINESKAESIEVKTEPNRPDTAITNSRSSTQGDACGNHETPNANLNLLSSMKVETEPHLGKRLILCGEDLPNLPDDTEDVDDIQESEHFDTRQSFLNLCQGNHYQFDQLRRAKHSSMMVLYHLHNPDAPKFVPSCGNCHVDILTGIRYRCEKCELDYCQTCVSRLGTSIHNHPLRAINGSNAAPAKLTEEQRRERQRSIQLHMQLLNHAANCLKCDSRNCAKMKVLIWIFVGLSLILFFYSGFFTS